MNMEKWVSNQIFTRKKSPLPVLSFPAIQDMGITVNDLIYSSDHQVEALKRIHERTSMPAVLAFMDLSVEAEMFGSTIRYSDDEVPTVIGSVIDEDTDLDTVEIPDCRQGRTGVCIDAIRKVSKEINDVPVLAGCIGPFSLAGRLMDVNEVMFMCYDEPELVHGVLDKVTEFLLDYASELKAAGADGVVMAEPLAGLLSPALTADFSSPYVKRIIDAVQDESFIVILHNCGSSVKYTIRSLVETGAKGLHLGNAVDMFEMVPQVPSDVLCLGNIDPANQFRNGTPESIYAKTIELLSECSRFPNFVISSGCDIPPMSPWENIDAFFKAAEDFYSAEGPVVIPTAASATHAPTMTSRERFEAAIKHEAVDRVPVNTFIAGANRVLVGVDHRDWATSAENCSKGYIEMSKMFPEEDFTLLAVDFMVESSAWGQKIHYTGNNPGKPDFSQMLVQDIDDYDKIATVDAASSHRMNMMVEVCERLVDEFKGERPIIVYEMGPLSTLSEMRGQKQLARDLASNPNEVAAAAKRVAGTLRQFGEMLMDTGIDGIMWDTYYAAGGFTNRETWKLAEGGLMADLSEMVRSKGGINMVHSCQRDVFFDVQIEAVKPEVISFFHKPDDCADYAEVKAKYGDKVTLMGSITPWNAVFGTDLNWDDECRSIVDSMAGDSGFILSPGCFYPANASLGRAKRMIDIATTYGVRQ